MHPGSQLPLRHPFQRLLELTSTRLSLVVLLVAWVWATPAAERSTHIVICLFLQAQYNFPYPTTSSDGSAIPAYPVRAACHLLADPSLEGTPLFTAMSQTVSVFKGNTSATCLGTTGSAQIDSHPFTYQVCTLPGPTPQPAGC